MSVVKDDAPLGYPEASEKGLKGGALGLLSSVVVGMSVHSPRVLPRREPRVRRGVRTAPCWPG